MKFGKYKCESCSTAFATYSLSSTNTLDLFNSSSSSAFQAALLFFQRSSDMYAYFASQLNSKHYILNQWQSHLLLLSLAFSNLDLLNVRRQDCCFFAFLLRSDFIIKLNCNRKTVLFPEFQYIFKGRSINACTVKPVGSSDLLLLILGNINNQ